MKTYKYITYIVLSLLNFSVLHAVNYYFSDSNGSDTNSVIQAKCQFTPWKSIAKLNQMQHLLRPGDSILFKSGDVFCGSIIVNVSGKTHQPIVFGSYGAGAKPVLSGCVKIGNWKNKSGHIWESTHAHLKSMPTALTLNDSLKPLGRYPDINQPNRGYLTIDSHPKGSKKLFVDAELKGSPDWNGAEVVLRTNHYVINRIALLKQKNDTIELASNTSYELNDKFGYFFQNHPNALDMNGEWCYLPNEQKIQMYYNGNLNNEVVAVANTNHIFSISNQSHIVIDGFELKCAKIAAVQLSKVSNIAIKNCDLLNSGASDINMKSLYAHDGSKYIVIENNTFSNCQSSSINLSCKNVIIKNNKFENTATIPGMGESGQKYHCIWVLGDSVLIEGNSIRNTGYVPIHFLWSNNVTVSNNFIDNFCNVIDDGGGIYCWTGLKNPVAINRKITNNIVLNGIGAKEGTYSTFEYLPVEGIYVDDISQNVEVSGNTVAFMPNSGIYMHHSPNCSVTNNTVFACGKYNLLLDDHKSTNFSNCKISRNILIATDISEKQKLIRYRTSQASNLTKIGTIDENIFFQPFSDSNYIEFKATTPETNKNLNLDEWSKLSGYDQKSSFNQVAFDKTSKNTNVQIPELYRFEYNASAKAQLIVADKNYVTPLGIEYKTGAKIKIPAYGSIILIKK